MAKITKKQSKQAKKSIEETKRSFGILIRQLIEEENKKGNILDVKELAGLLYDIENDLDSLKGYL